MWLDGLSNAGLTSSLKQIVMTGRTRDTIALFSIASLAILAVLYADADLGQLFHAILARW
jgi:hypothetical protein